MIMENYLDSQQSHVWYNLNFNSHNIYSMPILSPPASL